MIYETLFSILYEIELQSKHFTRFKSVKIQLLIFADDEIA